MTLSVLREDTTFRDRPGHIIFIRRVSPPGVSYGSPAVLLTDLILSVTDRHIRHFSSLHKRIHRISVSITYISIHVVRAGFLSLRFFSQLQWLMNHPTCLPGLDQGKDKPSDSPQSSSGLSTTFTQRHKYTPSNTTADKQLFHLRTAPSSKDLVKNT